MPPLQHMHASEQQMHMHASELAASSEAPWAAKLRRSDTKPDIAALVGRGARAVEWENRGRETQKKLCLRARC